MKSELPAYYSALAPFRRVFSRGNPVLTYHKLGPRPPRARLKGMYLSQRLFARQLQELRAAGFVSGSLGDCVGPLRDKRIIITFGRPIQHFCYPYGDWNEAVRDLVADAGYQTACTTQPGVNTAGDSPFALKRFTARYPSRNLKAIWARLRTWRL